MAVPAARPYVAYADYLTIEEQTGKKHEWLNGAVYDMEALGMAGGTPDHAALIMAVGIALGTQLRGKPCRVFSADLKVRIPATGLATYPDLTVICGSLALDAEDRNAATNPVLLVEVLSDSSEGYDRGEKFAHYRRLPSLREYVLVSQRSRRIEVFRKNASDKWELAEEATAGQSAPLASIGCTLSVDEVYEDPLAGAAG